MARRRGLAAHHALSDAIGFAFQWVIAGADFELRLQPAASASKCRIGWRDIMADTHRPAACQLASTRRGGSRDWRARCGRSGEAAHLPRAARSAAGSLLSTAFGNLPLASLSA